MILYHGTNADFGEIDLRKSKPNKKNTGTGTKNTGTDTVSRDYSKSSNRSE